MKYSNFNGNVTIYETLPRNKTHFPGLNILFYSSELQIVIRFSGEKVSHKYGFTIYLIICLYMNITFKCLW